MMKTLFAAALFASLSVAPTLAGQPSPLSMGIDRTVDPSPICVYRLSSGACMPIGTMGSNGAFTPILAPGSITAQTLASGAALANLGFTPFAAGGGTISGASQVSNLGCTPTTGAQATDGTSSWAPGCSASFVGINPLAFIDPSPTGQAYNTNGSINTLLTTTSQVFINAIAQPSSVGQNGLFLAFDSGNGAPAGAGLANNTALLVVSRQHPFPNGAAAPPTWTVNTNTLCAPGSGGSICIDFEQDTTNFDKPCAHVSDGCAIHVANWHNYQSAFPIAQDTYISANTAWQDAVVTVSGTNVTPTSGKPFSNDTTTLYLGMTSPPAGASTGVTPAGGTRYRVNPGSYNATTGSVTLLTTPTQQGAGINSAWNPHAVADVWLLSGDTVASDADLLDNTSAYDALQFVGYHYVIVDSSQDAAPIFAALRTGQYLCFSGVTQCLVYANGALTFGAGIAAGEYTANGTGPYGFYDLSTAPTGYYAGGQNNYATMFLQGTGPIGLLIDGTKVTQAQIKGTGFSINPTGSGIFASLASMGGLSEASATLITTTVAFTNGAAAQTATLTNGPTAGNPSKWIPINDNGTTRYIPAW